MRLVTFDDGGQAKVGVRINDDIIDVSSAAASYGGDMIGVIKGGEAAKAALASAAEGGARMAMSDVKLAPPIPRPGKVLCIGRNYAAHAAEGGDQQQPGEEDELLGHEGGPEDREATVDQIEVDPRPTLPLEPRAHVEDRQQDHQDDPAPGLEASIHPERIDLPPLVVEADRLDFLVARRF